MPELEVIQDHISLWGKIPKKYLRHIGVAVRGSGYSFFPDLGVRDQLAVLRRTFWYKRCSKPVRHRIRSMLSSKRCLELKEILSSADGILISVLLSFPHHPWEYALTDRIMVSSISNILFDRTFLPRWKKWKKLSRKALLTRQPMPAISRSWSWMAKFKTPDVETRSGLVSVMNLTQTRSTGLGSPSGDAESIAKLVRTVTTDETPITGELPSKYLRDRLATETSKLSYKKAMSGAHASISTTACYEAAPSAGGKAHAVANQVFFEKHNRRRIDAGEITGKPVTNFIDLETGEDTGIPVPLEKIGEFIFHESLRRFKCGYMYMYHCNVSTIREPGPKWRTITASSIFHAEALQPWSHACLTLLGSIEECNSGVSKSRHGWEFAESLSPEDPDLQWVFDSRVKKEGFSTDLETATDYFPWQVVRDIVDVLNDVYGFPRWYGEVVKELLTTPRQLMHNGELLCVTKRAALMGDPGTKAVLTCLGLAAAVKAQQLHTWVYARVVGDDFASIGVVGSDVTIRQAITSWGMKLSEDDTYTGDFVFFTEELIRVPRSVHDTIDRIKKSRKWGRSIYVDSVKIRLLLDVRKNRDDYSYTPVGRISQYGKDMSYLKKGSDNRALFHLGSMIQDVVLNTLEHDGAVYFPFHIYGEGKPCLFDNPRNTLRFWLQQRGGSLVANFMRIARDALYYRNDIGLNVERSAVLKTAAIGQRHSKNEAWRVRFKPADVPEIQEHKLATIPRYEKATARILGRLSEFVISDREISGITAKAEFIDALLNEEDIPVREWRLVDVEPSEVPMTLAEMQEFFRVWLEDPNSFRSIKIEEFFSREETEKILMDRYPLKTELRLVPRYETLRFRPKRNRLEDHEGAQLYEWLKTAYSQPENVPDIPRDNLSDDEFILENLYLEHTVFFVITDDKKMANALALARRNRGTRYRTYRIPCNTWAAGKWSYKEFGEPMTEFNYEVDMGSVMAYFSQLSIDEETAKRAQEAIAKGSSILRMKGTDVRTLRTPNIKPGSAYVSPYNEVVIGEEEEITFPPKGYPERFRVRVRYV